MGNGLAVTEAKLAALDGLADIDTVMRAGRTPDAQVGGPRSHHRPGRQSLIRARGLWTRATVSKTALMSTGEDTGSGTSPTAPASESTSNSSNVTPASKGSR